MGNRVSNHNGWVDWGAVPKVTFLPTESDERKKLPIATGVIDYFPLAFAAIAELSRIGNDKHNPGQPLHWSRHLSDDHPDCLMRHFIERGKVDVNGVRHSTQVAWRALAILQLELEKAAVDAAEENAWRLGGGRGDDTAYANRLRELGHDPRYIKARMAGLAAYEWPPTILDTLRREAEQVNARAWPDIPPGPPGVPDEAIGLPCDVEPSGHGEGEL